MLFRTYEIPYFAWRCYLQLQLIKLHFWFDCDLLHNPSFNWTITDFKDQFTNKLSIISTSVSSLHSVAACVASCVSLETGVAHSSTHKHFNYLLAHSDLPNDTALAARRRGMALTGRPRMNWERYVGRIVTYDTKAWQRASRGDPESTTCI